MANDNTSIVVPRLLPRFPRPRLEAKKGRPKLMLDEEGGKGNGWEERASLITLGIEKVQLSLILCIFSFAALLQLLLTTHRIPNPNVLAGNL